MSTARATLAAEHRDITGKKVARLRRAGRLPGVVYGHGVDSTSISVDAHEFEQLRRHSGPNALVDLSVDGGEAEPGPRLGVQVHPVNRRTLHVDLFLVRMTEELTVDVPLVAIGDLAGRGTPAAARSSTRSSPSRIRALPDHLPQSIEYSVESLIDFDTTIHVRDLTIPDDVTLLTDGDEIIAKVQAPRVGGRRGPGGRRGRGRRRRGCRGRRGRRGCPAEGGSPTGATGSDGQAPDSSGATRSAASAEVITGTTSNSTMSLHWAIHSSIRRGSDASMSWKQRASGSSTQLEM